MLPSNQQLGCTAGAPLLQPLPLLWYFCIWIQPLWSEKRGFSFHWTLRKDPGLESGSTMYLTTDLLQTCVPSLKTESTQHGREQSCSSFTQPSCWYLWCQVCQGQLVSQHSSSCPGCKDVLAAINKPLPARAVQWGSRFSSAPRTTAVLYSPLGQSQLVLMETASVAGVKHHTQTISDHFLLSMQ